VKKRKKRVLMAKAKWDRGRDTADPMKVNTAPPFFNSSSSEIWNSRPQMTTIINTSHVMKKTGKCGLRTYIPAEVDTDVHHHQPGLA
jgi:hypothetical protein